MRDAKRHIQEGHPEFALAPLTAAVRLRPDHVPTLNAHASVLYRNGEASAGLLYFRKVLSIEPCNVAALHGSGLALHAMGDLPGALDAFRKAITLDPAAWRSWQSIADIAPGEAERIGALEAAANVLQDIGGCDTPPGHILQTAARALVCAGRADEALSLIHSRIEAFSDKAIAQALLAGAHSALGQFEQAAHYQALALPPIAGRMAHPSPSFEPGQALAALARLTGCLEEGGYRPFLTGGTLLGFIRSGGPLEHDRDIDIGLIRSKDWPGDLVDFIRSHPDVLLPRSARPGDRYAGLTVNEVAADIFVFDRVPGGLVCGFSRLPGDIQWRHASFELSTIQCGEHAFRIPDPAERFLAECYGPGWQRPDHGFASALSAPALHQTSPHAIAFLALARARSCLLTGNHDKAVSLLGQIPPAAVPACLPEYPPAGYFAGHCRDQ